MTFISNNYSPFIIILPQKMMINKHIKFYHICIYIYSLSCVKIKPFKTSIKEKKKIESNFCNHLEIYINIMYVQFHTHLWTNRDPIALSCHSKKKKSMVLLFVSMCELHKKNGIIAPNV